LRLLCDVARNDTHVATKSAPQKRKPLASDGERRNFVDVISVETDDTERTFRTHR
jgi:hypothetical protein